MMSDEIGLHEQVRHRAVQLETAAQISSAASSILDLDELLPMAVELIRERFGLYYVGMFLLDDDESSPAGDVQVALLQAGTGSAGQQMVKDGHRLEVGGTSMIGWCVANAQARIALDVGEEAVRFENPLLPHTRSEMALPLVSRGRVIGAMTIQSAEPAAFSQEDVTVLQTMADQLANAIENARLYAETQRRMREMEAINEIGQLVASVLDLDAVLRRVVDTAKERFGYYFVGILLLEGNHLAFRYGSAIGDAGARWRRSDLRLSMDGPGLTVAAAQSAQAVLVNDVGRDPRYLTVPELADTRAEVAVPIEVKQHVIGVLDVQSDRRFAFDRNDVALLQSLASQAGVAIENARLFQEAQRSMGRTQLLLRVSEATASTVETVEVMRRVARAAARAVDADSSAVYELDHARQELRPVAGYRVPPEQWETYRDTPFLVNAHPFLQAAVRERQTILTSDATQDRRYDNVLAHLIPAQSVLLTPMMVREEVIGVLGLAWWEETRQLDTGEIELVEGIVHQAAVAVENARLFEAAHSRAEELTVLNDLARALTARLDVDQVLQETHRGVARLLDTANFFIGLYNPQQHEVTIPLNITESQTDSQITVVPADRGITGYMIRNRASVLIKDNMLGWQEKMGVQLVGQPAASWLGAPLMIGDQVIGVMAVQSYTTPRAYDEHDQELLIAIASQAAVALQNAQLFEQTQVRARSERKLREVVAAVSASEDLPASLPTITQRLRELVPVDALTVAAYTPGDSEYRILGLGTEPEENHVVHQHPRAPLEGTAPGWVITHNHIWMDTDFRETQPFREDADLVAEGLASRIVLPLRAGRLVIGALDMVSTKPGAYSEAVVPILEQVADQMALTLERARLLAETRAALAEVEAAHRSYLRRGWQDHLRQREVLRGGGYVYDQAGIEDTGAVELVPGLWRPEMEEALRSAAPALSIPEPLPARADSRAAQPIGNERERTGLAVPIVLRGQVLGVLGVEAPSGGRQWTGDDVALVEAIAEQLGQALESARLFAETQRRVERERIIGEITAKVRSSTDIQRILETTAQELGQALGTSRAVVRLGLGESVAGSPGGTSPSQDG